MYQNIDDNRSNLNPTDYLSNQVYMPDPPLIISELLKFRRWNAEAYIRPMYYLALVIISILLLIFFIELIISDNAGIIIFGIIAVLLMCCGCVVCHRVIFELLMVCLQIPKLVLSVERLVVSLRTNMDKRAAQNTSLYSVGKQVDNEQISNNV